MTTLRKSKADAAAALKESIKEIYNIEIVAGTLEELEERQAAMIMDWTKRGTEREQAWADAAQARAMSDLRAEEEVTFRLAKLERDRLAELDERTTQAKRNEQFRQEDVTREIDERYAVLSAREEKVTELEAQVAAIPERMKKEIEKQVAIVTDTLKRQYAHERAMLEQAAVSTEVLADAKIASLTHALADSNNRNTTLASQLVVFNSAAQEFAKAAANDAGQQQIITSLQNALQSNGTQTSGRGR